MSDRTAYIDRPALSRNFEERDRVRYWNPVNARLSAWEGTITAVHYGTGFLDVETPFGNVRMGSEEVVLVGRDRLMQDTSLSTYDRDLYQERQGDPTYSYSNPSPDHTAPAGRVASQYQRRLKAAYLEAASHISGHDDELTAYNKAFARMGERFTDDEIREAVRVASLEMKTALYWKAKGRQYMPTKQELETGQFSCPRCSDDPVLKRTNYKKHIKLYACPSCLFLIKPADILDQVRPDDEVDGEELESIPSGDYIEPQGGSAAVRESLKKS